MRASYARFCLVVGVAVMPACTTIAARAPGEAPAGRRFTHIDTAGVTVLPSGRLLTPAGRQIVVAPHPYGLSLAPDGRVLVSANSGIGPFSISIIANPASASPSVKQVPPGFPTAPDDLRSVFMGLAFSPDSRTLYVSGGNDGTVRVFNQDGKQTGSISCNGAPGRGTYAESFIGDLSLSRDGRLLCAVDQANFRLVIIDPRARKVVNSVAVGRYPFAVAMSPEGKRAYVSNVGMYEYQAIGGGPLPYPPFGVPSRAADEGTSVDGHRVPALGNPNVPESFSVWTVDLTNVLEARVVAKVKTGTLVGATTALKFPAVGGSSPNSLVATARRVYVTNGNNDNVQVIDASSNRITATIALAPDPAVRQKGALPFGLALAPNGRRLYVAEAGLNAVAVIDTKSNRVMGHIPVGWYPSKVVVSADGRTLYVSNAKGFGSGPNAGPDFESKGRDPYIGGLMNGTISVIAVPADHDLPALTKRVLANNGFPRARPSENLVALRTRIKHIVFITKENRTFDEVFGDVPGANGISSLARYGANATVEAPNQPTLNGINVMPNHRALALRYGISDNFYADGDVSADGHRWLVGIYPNEWMETENAAVYGGQMGWSMTVPGRRAFAGSNASSMPEDYNESGSLFDHLARYHIPFRNYGEGFEFAGVEEDAGTEPTGARESLNIPMSRPLWENTSREFPIFNTNISDQYRTTQFLKDLKDWEDSPSGMPRFVNIALPNDHGAGLRPDAGYPYVASYMADNDLALGRIVEGLSRSRFWKETAIFVTEDDAQGGVDHVDAHRTILIAAGPYIKRGQISHRHASIPSVIHTINLLLGLPPLNQFDATSADLLDLFTTIPDVTGYTAVRPDLRVFNPSNLKDAEGLRMSRDSGPRMDDPAFIREQHEHPNAPTSVETR